MKLFAALFFLTIGFTTLASAATCGTNSCYATPCASCYDYMTPNPRAPQMVIPVRGPLTQKGALCTIENDTWDIIWVIRENKWPQKVIGGKIFRVELPVVLTDRDPDRPYLYAEAINPQVTHEYPIPHGFCERYSEDGTLKFTTVRNAAVVIAP